MSHICIQCCLFAFLSHAMESACRFVCNQLFCISCASPSHPVCAPVMFFVNVLLYRQATNKQLMITIDRARFMHTHTHTQWANANVQARCPQIQHKHRSCMLIHACIHTTPLNIYTNTHAHTHQTHWQKAQTSLSKFDFIATLHEREDSAADSNKGQS